MQTIMVTVVRDVRTVNIQNYSGFKRKNIQGHTAILLLQ
jgi:hypothetical protein